MAAGSSKKVIFAALAGNLLIAITKFAAALWTGSSAVLSEGVHSLVDTGNQGLLLYGHRRATRPPGSAARRAREREPPARRTASATLRPRALFLELHRRSTGVRPRRHRVV